MRQIDQDPILLSVFNNKGGVGKTTLTFHLGHALAHLGYRVLFMDLDPQCNLSIYSMSGEEIEAMWAKEDASIDDGLKEASKSTSIDEMLREPRSIHFLLKPEEDGEDAFKLLPPPVKLARNLDLVPGRLTLHMFEEKVSTRWSDLYRGDPLALRTASRLRGIAREYASSHGYDIVIVDTSPSLGALNKVAVMTVDYFVVPCFPDVFSLYGIKNIGRALAEWSKQMAILRTLLSEQKLGGLPQTPAKLLGYTIYNAKKYTGQSKWDLAQAHMHYADRIPEVVRASIAGELVADSQALSEPIGGTAVMHTHNTLPTMAQKYRVPMWQVPQQELEIEDQNTVRGSKQIYEATQRAYVAFANDLLARIGHDRPNFPTLQSRGEP